MAKISMLHKWKVNDLARDRFAANHGMKSRAKRSPCRLDIAHGDGPADSRTEATAGDFTDCDLSLIEQNRSLPQRQLALRKNADAPPRRTIFYLFAYDGGAGKAIVP